VGLIAYIVGLLVGGVARHVHRSQQSTPTSVRGESADEADTVLEATPSGMRLEASAQTACTTSLQKCKDSVASAEDAFGMWMEAHEGRPTEWTLTTTESAGEETLRRALLPCVGGNDVLMDCDEYPCIVHTATHDIGACLPRFLDAADVAAYSDQEGLTQYLVFVTLSGGPSIDPRRQAFRAGVFARETRAEP
jgi:hypothetical protein